MMIRQLPPESRTRTAELEAGSDDMWGSAEYLLADVADLIQHLILVTAYRGTGKKLPKIKPIPRPTDTLTKRQEALKAAYEQRRSVQLLFEQAEMAGVIQADDADDSPEVTGPTPEEA